MSITACDDARVESCKGGTLLVAGECRQLCDTTADCARGQVCSETKVCLPPGFRLPCSTDGECSANAICAEGGCASVCNQDTDCPTKVEACVQGLCEAVTSPRCFDDPDCPTLTPCASAHCQAGACVARSLAAGGFCDDANPCTSNDRCDGRGGCFGSAVTCASPPASSCSVDDTTFRTYPSLGACDRSTGECSYSEITFPCPSCSSTCLAACGASSCPTPTPCDVGLCLGGSPLQCSTQELPDGTTCERPGGDSGTCLAGSCVECFADSECPRAATEHPECFSARCVNHACAYEPLPTVVCAPGGCADGYRTAARTCGERGECTGGADQFCDGYACTPNGVACRTTCASDADCIAGYHCAGNRCEVDSGLLANGLPCSSSGACQSGYCDGGVCCTFGQRCCGTAADCPASMTTSSQCQVPYSQCQGTKQIAVCQNHVCAPRTIGDDTDCGQGPLPGYSMGCPAPNEGARCLDAADQTGQCPGSCPVLTNSPTPPPTEAAVQVASTAVGGTATYSCATAGYVLSGMATRTCQADLTWSGTPPTCVPVDCGQLSPPANGSVSVPSTTYSSSPPTQATYACNSPYVLSGLATRTCQANGTWSGTAPTCITLPAVGCTGAVTGISDGVVRFTLSSGADVTGCDWRDNDGAWLPLGSSNAECNFTDVGGAYQGFAVGNHVVTVRVRDASGNTATCATEPFYMPMAPTCSATVCTSDSLPGCGTTRGYSSTDFSYRLSITEDPRVTGSTACTFVYSNSGGSTQPAPVSPPCSTAGTGGSLGSGYPVGVNTLAVTATGPGGHTTCEASFTIDAAPCGPFSTTVGACTYEKATPTDSGQTASVPTNTATHTGTLHGTCNDGAWTNVFEDPVCAPRPAVSCNGTMTGITDGVVRFTLSSGADVVSCEFQDSTQPGVWYPLGASNAACNFVDAGGAYQAFGVGDHVVTVRVSDGAGNTATCATQQFYMPRAPTCSASVCTTASLPGCGTTTGTSSTDFSYRLSITEDSRVAGSTACSYVYTNSGGSSPPAPTTCTTAGTSGSLGSGYPRGPNTLTVTATGPGGHIDCAATFTVVDVSCTASVIDIVDGVVRFALSSGADVTACDWQDNGGAWNPLGSSNSQCNGQIASGYQAFSVGDHVVGVRVREPGGVTATCSTARFTMPPAPTCTGSITPNLGSPATVFSYSMSATDTGTTCSRTYTSPSGTVGPDPLASCFASNVPLGPGFAVGDHEFVVTATGPGGHNDCPGFTPSSPAQIWIGCTVTGEGPSPGTARFDLTSATAGVSATPVTRCDSRTRVGNGAWGNWNPLGSNNAQCNFQDFDVAVAPGQYTVEVRAYRSGGDYADCSTGTFTVP